MKFRKTCFFFVSLVLFFRLYGSHALARELPGQPYADIITLDVSLIKDTLIIKTDLVEGPDYNSTYYVLSILYEDILHYMLHDYYVRVENNTLVKYKEVSATTNFINHSITWEIPLAEIGSPNLTETRLRVSMLTELISDPSDLDELSVYYPTVEMRPPNGSFEVEDVYCSNWFNVYELTSQKVGELAVAYVTIQITGEVIGCFEVNIMREAKDLGDSKDIGGIRYGESLFKNEKLVIKAHLTVEESKHDIIPIGYYVQVYYLPHDAVGEHSPGAEIIYEMEEGYPPRLSIGGPTWIPFDTEPKKNVSDSMTEPEITETEETTISEDGGDVLEGIPGFPLNSVVIGLLFSLMLIFRARWESTRMY